VTATQADGYSNSFLVGASGRHVELRLCHGNRAALRLDRKAVLLEIPGAQVAADAGQWSNKGTVQLIPSFDP
jgi:hypothetical protein